MRELPGGSLGDRALVPTPSMLPQVVSPTISSLAVVSESLDAVAEVVGSLDSVSVGDLEKLISKHVITRKDITDAIKDAFTQTISGTIRDQSLLVKTQVRAAEVQRKSLPVDSSGARAGEDFRGIFKDSRSSKGSGPGGWGEGGSGPSKTLYDHYNALKDVLVTATTQPLALIDKVMDFGARKLSDVFKKGGGKRGKGGRGEEGSVFGERMGEGEVSSGGLGTLFGRDVGLGDVRSSRGFENIFGNVYSGGSDWGGLQVPLGVPGNPAWLENERGTMVNFSTGEVGGRGFFDGVFGNKGSVSNEEDLQGEVAESDLKTNSLLFRTFDEPEKSDFGNFLESRVAVGDSEKDGKGVPWGLIVGGLAVMGVLFAGDAIKKLINSGATFVEDMVDIFHDNKGNVSSFFGSALQNLRDFGKGIEWEELGKSLSDIAIVMSGALTQFLNWITDPKVSGQLGLAMEGLLRYLPVIATGVGRLVVKVLGFEELKDEHGMGTGQFVETSLPGFANVTDTLTGGLASTVAGGVASLISGTRNLFRSDSVVERILRVENEVLPGGKFRGEMVEMFRRDDGMPVNPFLHDVGGRWFLKPYPRRGVPIDTVDYLEEHPEDRRNFLMGMVGFKGGYHEQATGIPGTIEDAIITSDGQVIQTDPEDSIYAFKGDVSIAPANQVREYGWRDFSGGDSGRGNQNGVVNNYINSSNFDFTGMSPAPEFDPVGV